MHTVFYFSTTIQNLLLIHYILTIYLALQILLLFTDADKKPAEDLTSHTTLDVQDIVTKTHAISKGVLFNVHQSKLKEWRADSLGVLPEDMMQSC